MTRKSHLDWNTVPKDWQNAEASIVVGYHLLPGSVDVGCREGQADSSDTASGCKS